MQSNLAIVRRTFVTVAASLYLGLAVFVASGTAAEPPSKTAPSPLLKKGHPVDWWFVFKFSSKSFPQCGGGEKRQCPFGGKPESYQFFGLQFVHASSESPVLTKGSGCVGETVTDPLGATFDQVYDDAFNYVIWNDQFYDDPQIKGCTKSCGTPWGHSKGMLVWNNAGEGFVLQVTTPSWPAAGSKNTPRQTDGNTLGCIKNNNVKVSQHFFALRLRKSDLIHVLQALQNASVVTDLNNPQVVRNGGPADVQTLVANLGTRSTRSTHTRVKLSTGVELISKPSRLNVPPWQMVSAVLGGVSLRTATWWANPKIYTTTASKKISCWDSGLGKPGRVEIALTGHWEGQEFGLRGGPAPSFNHAKLAVSISGSNHYSIFGDLNQQGAISGKCSSSQNGRGGLFYVLNDERLFAGLTNLLDGDTGPTEAPK